MANNRIDKPVVPPASPNVERTRGDNAFGGGAARVSEPFAKMGPGWGQRHSPDVNKDISKRINTNTNKK